MKQFMGLVLALLIGAVLCPGAHGFTIESFPPSAVFVNTTPVGVAQLDAAVGVVGMTAEDFEDGFMAAGVNIDVNGTPSANIPTALSNVSLSGGAAQHWDGSQHLVVGIGAGDVLRFTFNPGVESVGIGVGDIETNFASNIRVLVNGVDFGAVSNLTGYQRSDNQREVYLRVDRDGGDAPITTLIFDSTTNPGRDGVSFDHLTFGTPAPEPASICLLVLAAIAWSARRPE